MRYQAALRPDRLFYRLIIPFWQLKDNRYTSK